MIISLVKEVYKIWITERPMQLAAAIAYYALFALAPVIFITLTIAGVFLDNIAIAERIFSRLEQILGPEIAQVIQGMVANVSIKLPETLSQWSWLSSLVGFLALLWAASGLFTNINFAINKLWKVPTASMSKSYGMLRRRLLSVAIVILIGLLLVVISTVNVLVSWLDVIFDIPTDYSLIVFLAFVGLTTFCFAIMYKYFPDVRLRWRDVWLGAGVAALLETVGLFLIGLFLRFGVFGSASAVAGSVAVLLIIMYYMAQIFLLGAVITRVYRSERVGKEESTIIS